MMEAGNAKVYLPYVCHRHVNLMHWVWWKWKYMLITVVDWMAT